MQVYVDCLNEIHELAESYRIAWEQPGLKLNHNATRGYHLVLPSSVTVSSDWDTAWGTALFFHYTTCCPAV